MRLIAISGPSLVCVARAAPEGLSDRFFVCSTGLASGTVGLFYVLEVPVVINWSVWDMAYHFSRFIALGNFFEGEMG